VERGGLHNLEQPRRGTWEVTGEVAAERPPETTEERIARLTNDLALLLKRQDDFERFVLKTMGIRRE
jgi:hypothetical protein